MSSILIYFQFQSLIQSEASDLQLAARNSQNSRPPCWEFQMLMYNNKTANDINSSKPELSHKKKHEYFYNMYSFIPLHYQNLIK